MLISEKAAFLFPRDRELQFAALATTQNYVNDYEKRMRILDPIPQENCTYELTYWVDMPSQDWAFFERCDIELVKKPEQFEGRPDVLFEFTEEYAERMKPYGRHVSQAFAVQCGTNVAKLPKLKQVKPKLAGTPIWLFPDGENLLHIRDEQITGMVGKACWETYLAASMGLPVIEVLPEGRSKTWLSKWTGTNFYRIVVPDGTEAFQIAQAQRSIEEQLAYRKPEEMLVKAG